MTYRTQETLVTFEHPFVLGGFDEVLPAGDYRIETDEELLEDLPFPAYRRIRVLVLLNAKSVNPGPRVLTIDPKELDAALIRDQMPEHTRASAEANQMAFDGPTESRQRSTDLRAIERADDEGMFSRPI